MSGRLFSYGVLILILIIGGSCKEIKSNLNEYKFTNRLINETSPYLLQHAHNPVDWHPWGEEALTLAREQQKPIFLSIGYSACHWCHVMEKESFENIEIAQLLNDHFICIKVDREERPDIDEIYMNAVQLMTPTGRGGWPLSVWLTPDLQPFFGGTYFPPDDRLGRIGLKKIVHNLIDVWQNDRNKILHSADQITAYLKQLNELQSVQIQFDLSLWKTAFKTADRNFDEKYGGFGSAPKFPQAMELSFLLRYYFHTREKRALEMVEKSLQEMALGGMYDQLGGGFHRYATDDRWLVPHFEKMLYDNALLTITYLEGFQITKVEFYADIAREVLDYVLRELTSTEGGFYSSQDADSEGEEGKFFVWQKDEIEKILGQEEAVLFCDIFDVSQGGNWEGKNILHYRRGLKGVAQELGLSEQKLKERLKQDRQKLFEARSRRIAPHTDDKILTAWNGLMISAMCKGYQILGDERYLNSAQNTIHFLLKNLYTNSKLLRTHRAGKSHLNGYLSDYALIVAALIDFYESSFEYSYLEKAIQLNELMVQKFWDREKGGFFFTANDHEKLIIRARSPYDNAVPAGNSVAVHNLLRLSAFTGDQTLKQKAEQAIKLYVRQIEQSPLGFAVLLSSLDFFWGNPKEIVVAGDRNSAVTNEMFTTIYNHYLPNKILVFADPSLIEGHGKNLKILPVIEGKATQNDQAKIYVCENHTCQSPFTSQMEYEEFYNKMNQIT